jgi:hypothetical protein
MPGAEERAPPPRIESVAGKPGHVRRLILREGRCPATSLLGRLQDFLNSKLEPRRVER